MNPTPRITRAFLLVWAVAALLSLHGTAQSAEKTPFDDYIAKPDSTYRWDVVNTVRKQGMTAFVVDLKSQTWRTTDDVDRTVWQHWVHIVKPDSAKADTAMLFITGGSNGDGPPAAPSGRVVEIARATNTVVVELKMIPNQPLVFHKDGVPRKEDDLIGYCWDQYLKTGDPTWLPRFPMVKSAVRAMDCVQELLSSRQGGNLPIKKFVVAGGSKRGWTTWLTGAADPRVAAIVPIVIDVVNVEVSMRHHFAAYGFWAPAIGNYVQHNITQRTGTPELKKLYELVDPYSYRDRLTMPKFILNAAGDQFFLPDSSQFYYDDLVGEKYLRYVPNTDHGMGNSDATESMAAFYYTIVNDKPRPQYTWTREGENTLRVSTKTKPAKVTLWQATNPDARDFRLEMIGPAYKPTEIQPESDGVYVGKVDKPEKGFTAFFVEMTYDVGAPVPLKLTTEVRVTPDVLPFADHDPAKGELQKTPRLKKN